MRPCLARIQDPSCRAIHLRRGAVQSLGQRLHLCDVKIVLVSSTRNPPLNRESQSRELTWIKVAAAKVRMKIVEVATSLSLGEVAWT